MMGLYGEAVSLALDSGEPWGLEIAKAYAKKPKDDDDLKKKLWLQVGVDFLVVDCDPFVE